MRTTKESVEISDFLLMPSRQSHLELPSLQRPHLSPSLPPRTHPSIKWVKFICWVSSFWLLSYRIYSANNRSVWRYEPWCYYNFRNHFWGIDGWKLYMHNCQSLSWIKKEIGNSQFEELSNERKSSNKMQDMYFTSDFKQREHFSEKGVIFLPLYSYTIWRNHTFRQKSPRTESLPMPLFIPFNDSCYR